MNLLINLLKYYKVVNKVNLIIVLYIKYILN